MKNDIWSATAPMPLDPSEAPANARSPWLDAKVMMVDDEPLMTDLIQTHLEDAGYSNFAVTNDPREALQLLRREKPGLLLLDLMMPGISGFDLLEALRADRELRYTPVIVLTASTGADSKLRALQLGATDFLSKPVDASELALRVRNTLAFQIYHERMIHFDQATGLPTEQLFEDEIDDLLSRNSQRRSLVALFSIALPTYRELRDSVGRDTSQAFASVMARRLERFAAATEVPSAFDGSDRRRHRVARLGEAHFGLVLDGLQDGDAVHAAGRALLAALREAVPLGPHEAVPVPWLGIAVSPSDGGVASLLRQSADLALAHAQQIATSQIAFASAELNAKSYERVTLGAQLRGAAHRGELRLHYQPKVDMQTGRISAAEALVRWQHPEHGLIPPLKFIPLAEELGLMGSIGEWVIQQACADASAWIAAGLGEIKVAVNVSKPQFGAGDLSEIVSDATLESGLPARLLVVELTESMLMDDASESLAQMHKLKSVGVTLSIDDFGTGYSSLSYLKKFPLDELKIDRSFVVDLPGLPADRALVRSVIDLGHSLQMSVTAEGVETDSQLACLKQLGCDTYQGFLFSRPVSAQRFVELLERNRDQRAAASSDEALRVLEP